MLWRRLLHRHVSAMSKVAVGATRIQASMQMVTTVGQLGGVATPLITGFLLDHYGWDSVLGFMVGISCLTFLIVLSIIEPVKISAVPRMALQPRPG